MKTLTRLISFLPAAALCALLAFALGCDGDGGGGTAGGSSKPQVVATTTMIGDLVARIGGDRVDVKVLMPPGTDPHTFKPAPADIALLGGADLIFYNGLHLEGTMVDLFEDPKKLKEQSTAVAEAVPHERLLGWDQSQGGGAHDPHVWFDAELWALAAGAVRDRLIKHDPGGEAGYRERADAVIKSLHALHAEVKQKIASLPTERRVLITSHDAYNYFGRAYGIEVLGIQGISTETEAGLQARNAAVDFILKRRIPAIFPESSVNRKTIESIQRDVSQHGFTVAVGEELYSDAMGKPGEHPGYEVHTYEGMMRYNVDTIVKALSK